MLPASSTSPLDLDLCVLSRSEMPIARACTAAFFLSARRLHMQTFTCTLQQGAAVYTAFALQLAHCFCAGQRIAALGNRKLLQSLIDNSADGGSADGGDRNGNDGVSNSGSSSSSDWGSGGSSSNSGANGNNGNGGTGGDGGNGGQSCYQSSAVPRCCLAAKF